MSDQIIKWLNEEAKLSKKVTSVERDFANGKLFAELISKQNPKINLASFSNKDQAADRVSNFKALEPHLKTLNIKLDAGTVNSLIKEEKGVALKILYQMKMMLESKNKANKLTTSKSPETFGATMPAQQAQRLLGTTIQQGNKTHNKSISPFDRTGLSKNAFIEKKLEKFEITRMKNDDKALKEIQEMQRRYQEVKAEARQMHLETLRKNKEYLVEMDKQGWEDWKKNEDIKLTRLAKEREFEEKMTHALKKRFLDKEEFEKGDATEGVKDFELNAQKLGVELEHDPEEIKTVEKGEISQNALMIKLKEKAEHSELARKERDKRMRKMKVDQEKAQVEIETRKREEVLLEKLLAHSKQESEICFNKWRTEQMKRVQTQNRRLKEETLRDKKKQEIHRSQVNKDSQATKNTDDERLQAKMKKLAQREHNVNLIVEKRKKHQVLCSHLFNQIMEVVEMCYQQQQANDNIQIDARFWRNCCSLFVDDKIFLPKKKLRHEALENVESNFQAEQEMEKFLLTELSNYLNGRETWKPFHQSRLIGGPSEEDVPSLPINNDKLGYVIQNIIDTTYPPQEPKKPSPEIPNYLPLRLLALGYAFSGRKTISAFLKQKFGIEILKMEDILKEAVDLNAPPPPEDPKKAKKPPVKGKEVEVPKQENEELKKVGLVIKELQEKGEPIPIEIYIEAFKAKIKELFPVLTPEQLLNEVKLYKQKEDERVLELQKQMENEAKKKKAPPKKGEAPAAETEAIVIQKRPYYTRGWILVGFPGTYDQLKVFEQTLSGYQPEEELLNHEAEERKRRAEMIVRVPPKPLTKNKFIEGGIDYALKLEIPRENCVKRALGRRVDPKTGNMYNLFDNPPPANDNALMDRLAPVNDPENTEEKLNEKMDFYDENKEGLEGWLEMFGIEAAQLECLQRIDATGKLEEVQVKVEARVNQLLEFKMKEKYDKILEQEEEIRKQAQNAEAQGKAVEETKQDNTQQVEAGVNEEIKENKGDINQDVIAAELEQIPTERTEFNFKRDMQALSSLWEHIQDSYVNVIKDSFNNMNAQRTFISTRFSEIQTRFLGVLQKQGEKLGTLRKFNEKFNRFIEDNPEILDEAETKIELNQRLEALQDKLWSILEAKKDKAIEERKEIMESGYIEEEIEFFITNIHKLVHAELERYFGCVKLMKNYLCCFEGKGPQEGETPANFDVLPHDAIILKNAPPIENAEDPESFPRIELMYQNAVRLLNAEERVPSGTKKSASSTKRSVPASQESKIKKNDSIFSEKKEDPLAKEIEEAVNTERAIIRYRLFILQTIAITRVKEMRLMAKALYNKLDDWIIYGIKAENDSVYEQTKTIKKAIDKQEKLQRELNATYPDISFTHKPLNYSNISPIVLPQGEKIMPSRFTLTQLFGITEELSFLREDDGYIKTTTLSQFLARRLMSNVSKNDFPADWNAKGPKRCPKFIENLDPNSTGLISWKVLCNQLCLLDAPIPTRAELIDYSNRLMDDSENGLITKESFMKVNTFFDRPDTITKDLKNHPVFERCDLLKEILFYVNQELEHEVIDVNEYITNISPLKPLSPEEESSIIEERSRSKGNRENPKALLSSRRTYAEVLFSNV